MTMRSFPRATILLILIIPSIGRCSSLSVANERYEEFMRLAQEGKKTEALELGKRLFQTLAADRSDHPALVVLAKRLDAAQQVDALITTGTARASRAQLLEGMAGMGDLPLAPPASTEGDVPADLLPSAQELYWTHQGAFVGEIVWNGLPAQQATFLGTYYELQMQEAIMKIGRRVTITDPNSLENTCYAVVLPLVYLQGRDNAWEQMELLLALFSPQQLDVLWRFSLLQAERPQASAQIARYQAKTTGQEFSLTAWAPVAAEACVANHRPDLAQTLLHTAIDATKDQSQVAELRLTIAEGHARCGDYAAAAQTCKTMAEDLPELPLYGRAMAMYFGYLAREAKADQIVTETEPALQDPRCKPYLPQILYLRWWALCKGNRPDEAVRIAQRLMEQYPDNPCVAPVILERATDALVHQEYNKCRELLGRLAQDFPGTESAKRARDILTRLNGSPVE